MPTLHVNNGKNDTSPATDLGYLLTNEMPTPRITNPFMFNNEIWLVRDSVESTTTANRSMSSVGKILAAQGIENYNPIQISSFKQVSESKYNPEPIQLFGDNNHFGGTTRLGVKLTEGGLFNYSN